MSYTLYIYNVHYKHLTLKDLVNIAAEHWAYFGDTSYEIVSELTGEVITHFKVKGQLLTLAQLVELAPYIGSEALR